MIDKLYHYKASLIRVIDGDTVVLRIDLGFETYKECSCRLYGINTPELRKKAEKEAAIKSKEFLISLLDGRELYIKSNELDKYGRPLITITCDNIVVNKAMVENNFAVPYLVD